MIRFQQSKNLRVVIVQNSGNVCNTLTIRWVKKNIYVDANDGKCLVYFMEFHKIHLLWKPI